MKSHETAMLTLRSKADVDLCSKKEFRLDVCTEARAGYSVVGSSPFSNKNQQVFLAFLSYCWECMLEMGCGTKPKLLTSSKLLFLMNLPTDHQSRCLFICLLMDKNLHSLN